MKVAVAWYGAEGQSSYRYYAAKGYDVTIVTPQVSADFPIPSGAQAIVGPDAFDHLEDFELVVRSSGIRPDVLKTNGKIWSATNEFFKHCPAPIIGVTGTKGKGTTASLIASILRAAGKTVHLIGNIGVAPLEVLEDVKAEDIVVFELSSFQLWDIERSPHVAVVLMIEPDHLNVHSNMAEYVNAKANITKFQSTQNVVVYFPENRYSTEIASQSMGRKIGYSNSADVGVYVKDGYFYHGNNQICPTGVLKIPGNHNLQNACAAATAALQLVDDYDAIVKGFSNFDGLPHRIKLVGEHQGVKYYDDNYSSALAATEAAVRSMDRPTVLIAGGFDKGIDIQDFAKFLAHSPNIKAIVLMGQVKTKLYQAIYDNGYYAVEVCDDEDNLRDVVAKAVSRTEPGDAVLMSPGFASFDMFKNFTDRGNQFIDIVENL